MPKIPPQFWIGLRLVVVLGALIVFVVLFGIVFWRAYYATEQPPEFDKPFVNFATILAGLVGGVVAAGFGVKPSKDLNAPKEQQKSKFARNIKGLGDVVCAGAEELRELIAGIYAAVYLAIGAVAIGFWIFCKLTPDLIVNLADVAIGLFVAIFQTFFYEPEKS